MARRSRPLPGGLAHTLVVGDVVNLAQRLRSGSAGADRAE
jgi:class 3 adenylate cyclase